jgi:hypothetical protein
MKHQLFLAECKITPDEKSLRIQFDDANAISDCVADYLQGALCERWEREDHLQNAPAEFARNLHGACDAPQLVALIAGLVAHLCENEDALADVDQLIESLQAIRQGVDV